MPWRGASAWCTLPSASPALWACQTLNAAEGELGPRKHLPWLVGAQLSACTVVLYFHSGHICCVIANLVDWVVIEQVKSALPILRQLIHSEDDEVLSNACRALSYLSDGSVDNIQAVIEAGAGPQLVELLRYCFLLWALTKRKTGSEATNFFI